MSSTLTRRYQILLRAYPRAHREAHADELLGTMLDGAAPDQRWPGAREAGSLVFQGLRARLDAGRRRTVAAVWADGLHVGAVLLLVMALVDQAALLVWDRDWAFRRIDGGLFLLGLLATVVVLRGRLVAGLVLTLAWLAGPVLQHRMPWAVLLAAVLLAGLAVHSRASRATRDVRPVRSWWWLLVVPPLFLLDYGPWWFGGGSQPQPFTVAGLLLLLVVALGGAFLDPRFAIVAAVLAVDGAAGVSLLWGPGTDGGDGALVRFEPQAGVLVYVPMAVALVLLAQVRGRRLARL